MKFTSNIKGLEKFIAFMTAEGYLEENDYQRSELIFEEKLAVEENVTALEKGAQQNE